MGTTGITWDSHENGSDNDYVMRMGLGGKKYGNVNRAMGMEMIFHCSFSTYHYEILFSNT